MKYKYAIVLTGCIASGKSSVANILKLYGFKVIDADEISHNVLDELANEIAQIFGKEFVDSKKVNRKKLGEYVFKDKFELTKLENLLHPKIKERIYKLADELEKTNFPYFVDIPLFYEKKNYDFNKVVVVYTPKQTVLKRLTKRDKIDEKTALQRLNLQIDIEEKRKMADFVIDNSGDLKHLNAQIEKFISNLKKIYSFSL
ncbi:dephospho-CoA kinase [Campylobacter sputorum subsp. bubulus]|uniref:Dephospho-CoA kinase n=1 Tax=Campylobacter sputorum subsp. sputorum TaxID=32024 RepID=A0A381DK34_9BACT|nr:dephospho-CoA kinase [Campylobacter sputorum]ASM34368.1 dephospho-CoA kinase [Campylobacter sputorum aubsp. sputorum RM3237]KAB0582241.1 dephospho-CoA kinase [Campylobacter sputorum subsp. sputorum]QEL04559.1 dephospho-CoA kinase [Campylobacter sputorum subsp. sputorum]SUX09335.1 dephospho-CoA kinase [Campylobacter sputorum subsp. bubulus]SUX11028.1 dephospho-CoA kinase [Campylobacter sputorum subsp. sputorum]